MTLSVGQALKQVNQDGTPMNIENYCEHTYRVTGIFGQSAHPVPSNPNAWGKKTYLVELEVVE